MPNCQQIQDSLIDYVDNDMDDHEVSLVETHISKCPKCNTFLENYKKVGTDLRDLFSGGDDEEESLPPELTERISKLLKSESSGQDD